jgi:drug/metabolite transporter (DMT)-like permease
LNQTSANTSSAQQQRMRADLTLLLVSLIWGIAFVAQRVAATSLNVYLFNAARYLIGGIILLPFLWWQKSRYGRGPSITWNNWLGIILAGAVLFAGATLQQLGLRTTTAANAGFITGMYVILVPLLLALLWRQPPGRTVWLAAIIAAAGLFLLSTGGSVRLVIGDLFELGGAFLWAFHVILIGLLVSRVSVITISIVQNLVCAGLSGLVFVFQGEWQALAGLDDAWWTIVYTGVVSIGIGYTLQALGQRHAPPSHAAIILSSEAVFAGIFGWILLGETLTLIQIMGCLLIISGILLSQAQRLRQSRSRKDDIQVESVYLE